MITKVINTLAWFHQYGGPAVPNGQTGIATENAPTPAH
jgi:hypothetical protein